jgi:restriction system protein
MRHQSGMKTIPPYQQFFNPTLDALHQLGGSASLEELTTVIIPTLGLPAALLEVRHGNTNQTEVEYRLAWARTYLKKFGMIENSARAVWSLTAKGTATTNVNIDEVLRYVRGQRVASETGLPGSEPEIEESQSEVAFWRDDLRSVLSQISPAAFERLCQRMLRESGFIEVEVTGRSGDGGIDGHGIIRIAGLISFPVLFQCKRHRDNIGASVVRDFRGAMVGRAEKGLIITTAGFTRDARLEATRDGAPPIDLIDGDLLMEKLKDLRLGIGTKMVEVVQIDAEWFKAL